MKNTLLLTATVMLVLCALLAGCTSPTASVIQPAETPVTTIPPTLSTTVTTATAMPDAIETLPPDKFVDIQINKQRPDSSIHLLYNGGTGEIAVQNILLKVIRPDGTITQDYMNNGDRKPRRGDELVVDGTRGRDQVQVFVTSNGRTYKILDEPLLLSYL